MPLDTIAPTSPRTISLARDGSGDGSAEAGGTGGSSDVPIGFLLFLGFFLLPAVSGDRRALESYPWSTKGAAHAVPELPIARPVTTPLRCP